MVGLPFLKHILALPKVKVCGKQLAHSVFNEITIYKGESSFEQGSRETTKGGEAIILVWGLKM